MGHTGAEIRRLQTDWFAPFFATCPAKCRKSAENRGFLYSSFFSGPLPAAATITVGIWYFSLLGPCRLPPPPPPPSLSSPRAHTSQDVTGFNSLPLDLCQSGARAKGCPGSSREELCWVLSVLGSLSLPGGGRRGPHLPTLSNCGELGLDF